VHPATVAAVWSGDSGWTLPEDGGGSCGVAVGDGLGDLAQRSRGQLPGPAGGGEQGQVLAFHRAVEGPLQGVQVEDLAVVGTSLISPCSLTWMPSSASSGASSRSKSRAIPGLYAISGPAHGGSGPRRMSLTSLIVAAPLPGGAVRVESATGWMQCWMQPMEMGQPPRGGCPS
jgi:hypothetical protein